MSAYLVSRILAMAWASGMCFGLLCGLLGIAWLISIPIVTILQHYFPSLRPRQPAPVYINLHGRRHDMILLDEPRVPKAPVRPSPKAVEQSDFYIAEPVETERFPAAPIVPMLLPSLNARDSGANGNVIDPIIPIRKRALLRYLRKLHPEALQTDSELVDGFLDSVKGASKRFRPL